MLTKEQRDEIMRLADDHADDERIGAYGRLADYLDSITAPEGWKLVPVEPTNKMRVAFFRQYDMAVTVGLPEYDSTDGFEMGYASMLAAAPQPGDSNDA